MKTNILMIASALYFALAGLALTFLPDEIASFFNIEPNQIISLALQLIGALYLGFAMINWMSRNSRIGGIYNRPIVFGNFIHFLVSVFAFIGVVKQSTGSQFTVLLVVTILYALFTLGFGYSLRTNPS